MHTVTMQTDVMDLREQMNAMRAWLDDHRCEHRRSTAIKAARACLCQSFSLWPRMRKRSQSASAVD
jgi:hypothetical protein